MEEYQILLIFLPEMVRFLFKWLKARFEAGRVNDRKNLSLTFRYNIFLNKNDKDINVPACALAAGGVEGDGMKRYSMAEARKNLTDLVSRAAYGGERIAIGRRNKDLAVLISLEDAKLLEYLEDRADLTASRKALKERGPDLDWEEVKKELDL